MKKINKIVCFYIMCFCFCHSINGYAQEEDKPYLIFSNNTESGFGAVMHSVLRALDLYDQGYYSGIHINLDHGIYLDLAVGPNWWEYFFEPVELGEKKSNIYVCTQFEVLQLTEQGFAIPKQRAFYLLQKYVRLKPHVTEKMNKFINKKFKNHFIVGVHHRGTDKVLECATIPYESTNWYLQQVIQNNMHRGPIKIFVASDDAHFLKYMKDQYPGYVIHTHCFRSVDDQPVHYNNSVISNYQKGEEALMDCLLMAKCDVLVRPWGSTLSVFSLKINPAVIDVSLQVAGGGVSVIQTN